MPFFKKQLFMTQQIKIGVLGGSGLYEIEGLEDVTSTSLATPFGAPSDDFTSGRLDGVDTVSYTHLTLPTILLV